MARQDETGNCSRCVHTQEIAAAKTDGERARLQRICLRCIRGCAKCEHGRRKDALDEFISLCEGNKTLRDVLLERTELRKLCRHCQNKGGGCRRCPTHERTVILSDVVDLFDGKGLFANKRNGLSKDWFDAKSHALDTAGKLSAIKERNRITYTLCTKCRKAPFTDDCAPHSGKEVVAFEAAENPDTVLEHADPFAFQPVTHDFRDFDERPTDGGGSQTNRTETLPAEIEEKLKIEIANFGSKLDLIDRELVFFLIGGGNLTTFGRMDWAKRYLPKLSVPMTKQAVHNRYKKVCQAMPLLKAVAHGSIGKGKGGHGRNKSQPTYQQLDMFAILGKSAAESHECETQQE